jgi:hypothetical protein
LKGDVSKQAMGDFIACFRCKIMNVFHDSPGERQGIDMLHLLGVLTGNEFEAVDTSVLMVDVNSGEVRP